MLWHTFSVVDYLAMKVMNGHILYWPFSVSSQNLDYVVFLILALLPAMSTFLIRIPIQAASLVYVSYFRAT